MYVVYIMDHIHHLLSESKKWKVAYIWDRREYFSMHNQSMNTWIEFSFEKFLGELSPNTSFLYPIN